MELFEIVVALLLGGATLAAAARRVAAPYPAMLALGGVGLAFLPGAPTLVLGSQLALALFVAPVLMGAAFETSPRDLRSSWRPVTSLALGAVLFTIAVVAVVARLLVPDMPWGAAIALGAIVSPPDAAAAAAVLKQLRPPQRLLVILEGESLFNDASALLVYRFVVGAALTGAVSGRTLLPTLLGITVGSVVLGLVLAWPILAVLARVRDLATTVVFQFCSTFGVWLLAEHLQLSGILTMVVYAIATSRRAHEVFSARLRISSAAVWEVAIFVLNVLAFTLMGFQLEAILDRVAGPTAARYGAVAAAICAAVIVARIAWVAGAAAFARDRGWRENAVIAWCGMRGPVTLAAALALPAGVGGAAAFPHRDLILVTSFGVVLGTLVLQGLTLRPLLRRLDLSPDDSVEREVSFARVETLREAVAAAVAIPDIEPTALVRRRYELELGRAETESAQASGGCTADPAGTAGVGAAHPHVQQATESVVRAAISAQRQRLVALRTNETIGDAAFQRLQRELDWAELGWAQLLPSLVREGDVDPD